MPRQLERRQASRAVMRRNRIAAMPSDSKAASPPQSALTGITAGTYSWQSAEADYGGLRTNFLQRANHPML
nr:hypothetical protein CFP56_13215 [Quercus suber]